MNSSFVLGAVIAVAIGFFTILGIVYRKFRFHQENKAIALSLSSASSSLSRQCKQHHVFPSFHGEDVRRGLLSYLLKEFKEKGIDVFIDNDIERSKVIGPELVEAIRGSMIAIVLISRNYASSTWCMNELVEIMKCRDELGQIVMTIFYEVDPSDVKKQTGDFGKVFRKTCKGKSKVDIGRWRQALADVAKIAGYHSPNYDSDAVMIETIATDVSNKLNDSTSSNDFDGLVGVEAHIMKIDSLLSLESDDIRMVGIWGPAGIGKTTIARALYRKLSSKFTHSAFIESIKGKFEQNYRDEQTFMFHLQEQLLSKTLNQKDLKIGHLGVAKARLKDKKVLVVLDDVDELDQLEAMANKTCWFGPGSRIIITTKDKKLLTAHNIKQIYEVGFPSTSEALEILCLSAFHQKSPLFGFEDMALEVTRLAGDLPLGLTVFGAYLRGVPRDQWIHALPRLRTSLDGKIEKVLKFSYDALCDKDQELFLHVACFFNGERINDLIEYLAESRLDVNHGVQVLVDKSLISIGGIDGRLLMHNLLEQLGKEIVRGQSVWKPGKRLFLVDPQEICDVLADNTGTGTIRGIDFDLSEIRGELIIDERAFERMSSLQFVRFRERGLDNNDKLLLPQGLRFRASKLRFLQWDKYPLTSFPREFHPQCLVKLEMQHSRLEKLWEEPIPLPCLKWMNLSASRNLQKIPNLSKATNLEALNAAFCTSLVEISSIGKATNLKKLILACCYELAVIPSCIGNATNLKTLNLGWCESLVEIPASIWSLKGINEFSVVGCIKLKHLGSRVKYSPNIFSNIRELDMSNTAIEEFPSSIMSFSGLFKLQMLAGESLRVFPDVPDRIRVIILQNTGIEEVPPSIQNLSHLTELSMSSCKKLKLLPTNINLESLSSLDFSGCTQLKTFPQISTSIKYLNLKDTAIEEVPSSIWTWFCLLDLNLESCKSLQGFRSVLDNIEELDSSNMETNLLGGGLDIIPPRSLRINLNGCKNLVSLPNFPDFLSFLEAANCESLERINGFFPNTERCFNFANCFKLSPETRDLIQVSNCKFALLPGGELPAYFDHQPRGGFLTVNLDQIPLPLFFRFKACLSLFHGLYLEDGNDNEFNHSMGDKNLSCNIWCVQNGVDIGYGSCNYHLPALLGFTEHLYFFESSISLNFPETEVNFNELDFEFKVTGKYWEVKGCGVQLLEDYGYCGDYLTETEYKESAEIKIARINTEE